MVSKSSHPLRSVITATTASIPPSVLSVITRSSQMLPKSSLTPHPEETLSQTQGEMPRDHKCHDLGIAAAKLQVLL
eukprot:symbB.v1.2.040286.t1/scaffold7125.1/size13199/2